VPQSLASAGLGVDIVDSADNCSDHLAVSCAINTAFNCNTKPPSQRKNGRLKCIWSIDAKTNYYIKILGC
jgi:hypothetical protein